MIKLAHAERRTENTVEGQRRIPSLGYLFQPGIEILRRERERERERGVQNPCGSQRTFHMHESRAHAIPCALSCCGTFRKVCPSFATENSMVRVLHLVSYPPADFIVAGLEEHDSFVQPVFRCTAPFQDKINTIPELHCVTSFLTFLPSTSFLSLFLSASYFYVYSYASVSFPTQLTLRASFRFRASC